MELTKNEHTEAVLYQLNYAFISCKNFFSFDKIKQLKELGLADDQIIALLVVKLANEVSFLKHQVRSMHELEPVVIELEFNNGEPFQKVA